MNAGERIQDGLEHAGRYAARNQLKTIVVVLVTALIAVSVGVAGIQMSMGMTLYVEDDSQTATDWETLKEDFETGNNVFVIVESGELHDPETIRAINRLDRRYTENIDETTTVTSLADVVRQGNGGEIPQTEAGVERAITRVRGQGPESAAMVDRLEPESGTTIILASYGNVDTFDRGAFLPQRDSDIIYNRVQTETDLAPLPPGMTTTITGQPVFENAAFGLMLPEMITLFAGAFALIFTVVYLVMRAKVERGWHVFLPLGTAMIALLYMIGAMGVFGFNFNAIMLGVMPIALGLGIDYGLQIHSRYVEEREAGCSPETAAAVATRTTGRALLIAMGATVIGLGSLLVSSVPPVRQFGITSATAVLASMALSVTLLPALLVRFDRDGYSQQSSDDATSTSNDWLETGSERFTSIVTGGRPLLTLFVALLLVTGGAYAYPQVEPNQEMMDFWPQDLDAKNDMDRLSDTVDSPKVMYVSISAEKAYSPETFRELARYQQLMLANNQVNAVQSPVLAVQMANDGSIPKTRNQLDTTLAQQTGSGMMAVRDPTETPSRVLLTFYVDDVEGEEVRTLIDEFDGNADLALTGAHDVRITGKPVLNRNVIENVTAGLTPMTIISFALGFVFLSFAFRSVRVSAIIVISVAGSAALLVAGGMYLLSVPWNPLTITMSSLTLGIGVTYGIHIYERFVFETETHDRPPLGAAATSVAKLSRPIIGSSFTTIFGFGILIVSRFPVLANFGVTTVLAIGLSLATAFGILPAVLTLRSSVSENKDATEQIPTAE
ncbi:RND family transporter [Halorubrum rutilum]|uniref:RND family transporter n=1 Tax=Halorubrum rutilum TaxID=1364933 RepID=A0ABD6AKD6_9EURY|nr:MMPL family transporter [Halorubrum rutilum]